MDIKDDTRADLSPLEQRRARLRAYADRVLEAVEALPMPKTALDGERSLRTITAADRMLIQIYSKVSAARPILPEVASPTAHGVADPSLSSYLGRPFSERFPSLWAALSPEAPPQPPPEQPQEQPDAPSEEVAFVYSYDDDDIDAPEEAPEEAPEARSPAALAALDLEQRANAILQAYLDSRAAEPEEDDEDDEDTTAPP
ncbi:hypothetical protein MMA231_01397 [Asticcacaulis sp. MM231]|uniref:hypothetical protein n=1 Tax=Asticcacaulis sp. MM231 TaxID=3157666 RepID=UPI0032D57AD4